MKKPLKCIGDADTLMRLGMYKVSKKWLNAYIPENDRILELLNENQVQEITN